VKTTKLILAALAAAKCVTLAHVGDTEDQVRAHFKYPPIEESRLTFRRANEPESHQKEGSYLCFVENGWLVGVNIIEGKSVTETWSRTSVLNWTSKPISSNDIERLRKEYGMRAISQGLWGNTTAWMQYDERHNAIRIADYDFMKPGGDVWPSPPTWYYREVVREWEKAASGESRKKSGNKRAQ
jgi:hypothetical protein